MRRVLLRAVVAAALCAGGCQSRDEQALPQVARQAALPGPLVLIGVDGLEWRLALDLMKQRRMPHVQQLMQDGAFARLGTLEPALSPPIWTSMATGVLPPRHGIVGFVRPGGRDGDGQPVLLTNRDRRVKAVWNIAGDAGLRSCVVGYWMTFPVEDAGGVMVAQTGAPPGGEAERTRKGGLQPGRSGQVHPPALEPRVFELARASAADVTTREDELYGDRSTWPPAMKRVVEHSRWSLAADAAYERIALELAAGSRRCDLLIVYLGLPDVLGHRFWRWTYPSDFSAASGADFSTAPAAEEVARFGDVLPRAYAQVDAFVGRMRRAAGEDATVIVASDHGMGAYRAKADIDLAREDGALLRTGGHSAARDAFIAAAGPGIARTTTPDHAAAAGSTASATALPDGITAIAKAGSILDTAPTLLALLGLPRGRDMDGHVLSSLLDRAFVRAHPLREIDGHTPDDWQAQRPLADAPDLESTERLEQLRALGYLQ